MAGARDVYLAIPTVHVAIEGWPNRGIQARAGFLTESPLHVATEVRTTRRGNHDFLTIVQTVQ